MIFNPRETIFPVLLGEGGVERGVDIPFRLRKHYTKALIVCRLELYIYSFTFCWPLSTFENELRTPSAVQSNVGL